ncbi:MAG: serine dehydratase [Ruminococcaceae bacterium]|nr:serine dehydratase [Oscillospiraceae bacterium]
MESMRSLYKIGRGPSSSHTIGPERACNAFREKHRTADSFRAVLYGSLAKTGPGHGTDAVIRKTFAPLPCEISADAAAQNLPHPNTLDLFAYKEGEEIGRARAMSIGGGTIRFEGEQADTFVSVYPEMSFCEIAAYCKENGMTLSAFAAMREGEALWSFLQEIWTAMKSAVRRGLADEGVLPGGLKVQKKAKALLENPYENEIPESRENRLVSAYAFAVSEQNASGETVVTAPTCGASGVLPAVLYYQQEKNGYTDAQLLRPLAAAGLIGNLIRTNACISGAACGCQAEVGTACAMAAAALGELFGLGIDQIEYAAEIAIEHHLGLTCDPIAGLVQIPCIERNAVAAMRALDAVNLAGLLWNTRKISFDRVVQTMKETGLDMHTAYKETAEAGLAKLPL